MEITAIRNDATKLKRVVKILKTVSHENRLSIVELLLERGPMAVMDIAREVDISQSNASQHLKSLEDVEVLTSDREGKNIYYKVAMPGISKLLLCIDDCAC